MRSLGSFLILMVLCFGKTSGCLVAQSSSQSHVFTTKKIITSSPMESSEENPDYMPILIHNPNLNLLKSIKTTVDTLEYSTSFPEKLRSVPGAQIVTGFEGPFDNGSTPNDDAIAVSNNGDVVAIRNSRISFYNSNHELIRTSSLFNFTSSLQIIGAKYDPRVIYDQEEDRFIIVLLTGYDHTTNEIIVCFSQTNDPAGEWNYYSIPGNVLEDDTWSDYPNIAINKDNLYISVTNFADLEDFSTWDFYGARIVQINKSDGYQGIEDIEYGYHVVDPGYNVSLPSKIHYYNVVPVKGGKSLYGPHMYFVSTLDCPFPDANESFPPRDTVFLMKVSGSTLDDFNVESDFLQSPIEYGISRQTPQPNDMFLQTNYNTIRDAYFSDNTIHFVFNSLDFSSGQAGIMHGIIRSVHQEKELDCNMISFDTMGVAFPSIAYIGTENDFDAAVIGFNYASPNLFPGNACLIYENNTYSDVTVLKEGEGVIDVMEGPDRWGDYTSIQVKYNEPQFVYFSGSYGKVEQQRTWVSKIEIPLDALQSKDIVEEKQFPATVFPNPMTDIISVDFEIDKPQVCFFKLYDAQGNLIETIFAKKVKQGSNLFSMNLAHLSSGIYTLRIEGEKGYQHNHKILKK